MKRLRLVTVAVGLTASAVCLTAARQNQREQPPASAQPSPQQQVDTQSARAFEGSIAKVNGKYVLEQTSTSQPYALDDQSKAKEFSGKRVKVTATMDPLSNTLHVVDITPAQR